MNKTFDCVQFQRDIREKLWKEAGETFEGLMKLLDERKKTSKLWLDFTERKEKAKQQAVS
jgi:hypothetical protein